MERGIKVEDGIIMEYNEEIGMWQDINPKLKIEPMPKKIGDNESFLDNEAIDLKNVWFDESGNMWCKIDGENVLMGKQASFFPDDSKEELDEDMELLSSNEEEDSEKSIIDLIKLLETEKEADSFTFPEESFIHEDYEKFIERLPVNVIKILESNFHNLRGNCHDIGKKRKIYEKAKKIYENETVDDNIINLLDSWRPVIEKIPPKFHILILYFISEKYCKSQITLGDLRDIQKKLDNDQKGVLKSIENLLQSQYVNEELRKGLQNMLLEMKKDNDINRRSIREISLSQQSIMRAIIPIMQGVKNERRDENWPDMTCSICLVDPRSHILDCGHFFCEKCTDRLRRRSDVISCPVCRKNSYKTLKVYF